MNYVDFSQVGMGEDFLIERVTKNMTNPDNDGHRVYHIAKKTSDDISTCGGNPTPSSPSLRVFPQLLKDWKKLNLPVVRTKFP